MMGRLAEGGDGKIMRGKNKRRVGSSQKCGITGSERPNLALWYSNVFQNISKYLFIGTRHSISEKKQYLQCIKRLRRGGKRMKKMRCHNVRRNILTV